jgi:hypothetical protein
MLLKDYIAKFNGNHQALDPAKCTISREDLPEILAWAEKNKALPNFSAMNDYSELFAKGEFNILFLSQNESVNTSQIRLERMNGGCSREKATDAAARLLKTLNPQLGGREFIIMLDFHQLIQSMMPKPKLDPMDF